MSRLSDEDVDRLLADAGERWRQSVPVTSAVDTRRLRDQPSSRRLTLVAVRATAMAAGLLVLLALAVAINPAASPSGASPSPSGPPAASVTAKPAATAAGPATPSYAFASAVVRPGDAVTAVGHLIEAADGALAICAVAVALAVPRAPPVCVPPAAPVAELDPREFPGDETAGRWATDYLMFSGTWNGQAMEVDAAAPAEPPISSVFQPVPCGPPADGWPGDLLDGVKGEDLVRRLQREVEGNPDRYAGFWSGVIGRAGDQDAERAMVVATVDDVELVAGHLRDIFPSNLCVVRARFSARELERVATLVGEMNESWRVTVDPAANRVAVEMVVLGEEAARLLSPYADRVDPRPLVVRAP